MAEKESGVEEDEQRNTLLNKTSRSRASLANDEAADQVDMKQVGNPANQTGFSQRKIVYSESPITVHSKKTPLRKSMIVESTVKRDNNS